MRSCTNCGYQMAPDDTFCAGCGSAQPTPMAAATVPAWARPEAAAASATAEPGTSQRTDGAAASAPTVTVPPVNTTGGSQTWANAAQESYFDGPRGGGPAGARVPPQAREPIELRYMRQTRTACVFIAVMVAIYSALLAIGIIVTIVKVNSLDNALNNGVSNLGNSNCLSQGGSNPNC